MAQPHLPAKIAGWKSAYAAQRPGSAALAACVGDCNGDGAVTADELLTMVGIALGQAPRAACRAGAPGGDGRIAIDDILLGANNALGACPQT
jgi:hypothetical protein